MGCAKSKNESSKQQRGNSFKESHESVSPGANTNNTTLDPTLNSVDTKNDARHYRRSSSETPRGSFTSKYMQNLMKARSSQQKKASRADAMKEIAGGLDQRTKGLEQIDETAQELKRSTRTFYKVTSDKKFLGQDS